VGHKLLRDIRGSVLVEYTIVFPLFILLVFGTVDVSYMLSEWAMASKAAYVGARTAVVADAVAPGITNPTYDQTMTGQLCFVPSTGATAVINGNNVCPTITATNCTGTPTGVSCTNGNSTAFTLIFNRMRAIFPRLQRTNVTVSYAPGTYTLGFNGEPNGLPVNVTVSITGMTHQMYFLGPIMRFFGGNFAANPAIPTFATTLPSEAMNSANL
jgi:Flp pilus assembly protein TadG